MSKSTPENGFGLSLEARAAHEARTRHDRCDDLAAASMEYDGDRVVYCENCGQVLLRWGGA